MQYCYFAVFFKEYKYLYIILKKEENSEEVFINSSGVIAGIQRDVLG